jgi:hypothetical protein
MKLTDQLQLSILTEVTKNLVESTFNRFQLNPSDYDYSELKDLKLAAEAVGRTWIASEIERYLNVLNPR